jgi:hypothetical protein
VTRLLDPGYQAGGARLSLDLSVPLHRSLLDADMGSLSGSDSISVQFG